MIYYVEQSKINGTNTFDLKHLEVCTKTRKCFTQEHGYGSKRPFMFGFLDSDNHIIATMDICGVILLKTYFDNVITI